MRILYSFLLYLLTPLFLLRLLWRGIKAPAYWQRWSERFGFSTPVFSEKPIWIHAVSVGEVRAAIPLIKSLRATYPSIPVLVTTTTPTGSAQVKQVLGEQTQHVYMPFDLPGVIKRFLANVRPRIVVIMETEIWPNLFHYCKQDSVPVVLANARMSKKSAAGYARLSGFVRNVLGDLAFVAAQHDVDATRLIKLGLSPERVQVTGSIKFDIHLPENLDAGVKELKRQLGENRPVWIAASTHSGEDEQILNAFNLVRQTIPDCLLIIVPRHPERFEQVTSLCKHYGFNVVRRSERKACDNTTEIFIGDTMGEMLLFYSVSDVAFIGGSLIEHGGQNPLEASAVGLPVLFGPYTFNFSEIIKLLTEAGAGSEIGSEQELAYGVVRYLKDNELRQKLGSKGKEVVEQNRGALEKLKKVINDYL
ncbi:MAG: lipid IV(A) 3-deoxy-D-manno-octulosonic acid transferase [Gammaproteobacteria bacterium]|nr:lipid IV(A) 3-deoxy-D-manno-octulosonic acid transferase [Gammaproteobacteria bacterium]MDH5614043.1 lipid IV(A) 3-deoxy-D-manno-octulosonic acid transferase [Gammaproteobacteria bacterium]